MKKFFSFLSKLISFVTMLGVVFCCIGYFFACKARKVNELFTKNNTDNSEEE